MPARDLCYGTDFEVRVARLLEAEGHTVYRSVYAVRGDTESQIDLVVLDKGTPICIECKAFDAVKVMYKRSSLWSYLGVDGKVHSVNNPIKRVNRQADTLFSSITSLEDSLPDNLTVPRALCAVMLKGDIPDYASEHVFTERSVDKLLAFCNFGNLTLDDRLLDAMHKWLAEHHETSEERLKRHIRYLNKSRKNKTGAFAERPSD